MFKVKSMERHREGQMPELLLDAKLWKKISESLEPSTQAFIQQNKGSGRNKFLLPVVALAIESKSIRKGGLARQFIRDKSDFAGRKDFYDLSASREVFVFANNQKFYEIEKAILKQCVRLELVESGIKYGGKRVLESDESLSSLPLGNSPKAVAEGMSVGYAYFVRNGDLFKIGISENLLRRMNELSPDELLNVVRCVNYQEVERELHRKFKDVRLPQTEYFRLSDSQVQEVHRLMMKLANFP